MNEKADGDAAGSEGVVPTDEQREHLAANIRATQARIAAAAARAGRSPGAVELLAVTKTVPAATIRAAYELGLTIFGENRVQEARTKLAELSLPGARWELIGHLQTNKAGHAATLFDRIQSVDSMRLAEALSGRAVAAGRRLPILLEVNVAGEASKSGFAPDDLIAAARALAALPGLDAQGLMTIAPLVDDPEQVRPVFRRLRELRDHVREAAPLTSDGGWRELSMGMSDDFEIAVEEGATLVRLGRVLFGARPTAPPASPPIS